MSGAPAMIAPTFKKGDAAQRSGRWAVVWLSCGGLAAGFLIVEVILRVVFWDGVTFSQNIGPIPEKFTARYYPEHSRNRFGARGPDAIGPKPTGRIRIMVQGDSITFGKGVRREADLYAVRLLHALEQAAPGRFELAVVARSGRNIDGHVEQLRTYGDAIAPDLIVYQWHPNDMELDHSQRPQVRGRVWRRLVFHAWLTKYSYAWSLMDNQLTQLLYRWTTPYPAYLREVFADGGTAWRQFVAYFEAWATEAFTRCPRVIVLLSPRQAAPQQRPAAYELRDLHTRVTALATGHGMDTIDVAQFLTDLPSWRSAWVNPFDSHPSELVHHRMATLLFEHIQRTWPEWFAGPVPGPSLARDVEARERPE